MTKFYELDDAFHLKHEVNKDLVHELAQVNKEHAENIQHLKKHFEQLNQNSK